MSELTGEPKGPDGHAAAPAERLSRLWRRAKDHRIAQWTVGYVAVAYGIQHAVILTSESFEWPNLVARVSMLALALGLPLAMTLAWYHGDSANRRVSGPELTIISLLLVGISLLFFVFVRPSGEGAASPAVRQAGVAAARVAAASPKGAISVAVLPFVNLSSDKEQEFFSDGMTEEITAALAKVPDLRVVARTSAFEFKGKNVNIKAMGDELGATHLIEGSVRKAGNRVRITAQLIKADDGTHIWSENYDRDLTDVFAIQEDIATAIAGALRMPLGLKPGERLVANRTIDTESYQQYLRAKPLVRALGRGVPQAIEILEPLVARNPDYAPALALLSDAYILTPTYHRNGSVDELRRFVDEFLPKGEAAARRAIQLDSNLADGYFALARYQGRRGKYLLAEEAFSKGFALDPNYALGLNNFSSLLAVLGRLKEALAMKQQVRALEPYVPGFTTATAEALWLNGQDDAAIAMLKEIQDQDAAAKADLAEIYAAMGRYNEAANLLQELPSIERRISPESVMEPVRLLRTAPAKSASPQSLPSLPGFVAFIYLHVGAPERVLDRREQSAKAGFFSSGGTENAFLWHSSYAPVRKTARFKAWIRAEGIVEYWRAKGWPEFCHPTTGDDFVCN